MLNVKVLHSKSYWSKSTEVWKHKETGSTKYRPAVKIVTLSHVAYQKQSSISRKDRPLQHSK